MKYCEVWYPGIKITSNEYITSGAILLYYSKRFHSEKWRVRRWDVASSPPQVTCFNHLEPNLVIAQLDIPDRPVKAVFNENGHTSSVLLAVNDLASDDLKACHIERKSVFEFRNENNIIV